jgi:hypothetical protein
MGDFRLSHSKTGLKKLKNSTAKTEEKIRERRIEPPRTPRTPREKRGRENMRWFL